MLLVMGLCNSLLYHARIGYENTYDMREELAMKILTTCVIFCIFISCQIRESVLIRLNLKPHTKQAHTGLALVNTMI